MHPNLVSWPDAKYVHRTHDTHLAVRSRHSYFICGFDMGYYLTLGALLGLSAGLAPGPLLTLVISETLRHDVRAGVRVALAPMVTDLPIILLTLFVLSGLAGFHGILGAVSMAGGIFILSMGYESLRTTGFDMKLQDAPRKSLRKGILTNLLSPHPYIFWLSVGGPTMAKALDRNFLAPAAFIAGFYFCLVGSKIALALLVGRSRALFKGRAYVWTMRLLGLALVVLALLMFRDGLQLTGLLAAPQT